MYFPPEVTDHEFPALIRRFKEITTWHPWEKRLTWLEAEVRKTVAMPHFWRERFELELAFASIHRRYKVTDRYPRKNLTIEQQRFLSFVATVVRCYERIDQRGKKRLRGMLLDSLKSDYGLGPVAYEMKIAAHLLNKGFDVTFHDLETGGGYDYLAVKNDLRMEIECKFVTGDIGRQIHLKRLYQFGEYFTPKLQDFLHRVCGGILVQITIPGRLHGHSTQHASISEQVFCAIGAKKSQFPFTENEVSVSNFALESSPFSRSNPENLRKEHVDQFVSDSFGIENTNMLILFRPRRHAVIVVLQSKKQDRVLTGIHRQLKDSASKQFTGTLPAILCCHLADLDEAEIVSLHRKHDEGVALDYMTSDLIDRRPQLLAVTYTAQGNIAYERVTQGNSEQHSQRESGPAYTIRNSSHSLASDGRYSIF